MKISMRLLALASALLMVLCLAACGEGEENISQPVSGDVSEDEDAPVGGNDATDSSTPAEKVTTTQKTTKGTKTQKTTEATLYTPTLDEPFDEGFSKPARDNTPWKQKGFQISTCRALPCDSGWPDDDFTNIIKAHKEAGFNLVENGIMGRADSFKAALACENAQMPFLVQNISEPYGFTGSGATAPDYSEALAKQIVQEMIGYQYLEGYYTWDEVTTRHFTDCKKLNGYFQKHDPGSLAYSLLLPSYGEYRWDYSGVDNWKKSAYYKYVTEYVEKVDPSVLSFDYYPFWLHGGNKTDLLNCDLWRDMGLFRKLSIETGKPFWYYLQADNFSNYTPSHDYTFTNAMRSVQMYYAIAYGAKSVSYFTTFDMEGFVDKEGKKLEGFAGIKALNEKVMNLGSYLFNKKSKEIYHFGIQDKNHILYQLDDVANSDLIADGPKGTIVSVFGDSSKAKYVLVVNKNYASSMTGTLTLKTNKKVKIYDHAKDKTLKVSDKTKTIDVALNSGECALYIVE